ncbi:MAG: T9SS type A sorting domain-containing protein [Bacteroidales bacterium]|nr:T9SS type A sorting domain-containing protein [Bacteroidales bacterium]
MKNLLILSVHLLLICNLIKAQPWVQNDAVFNPSGIPSLPFSQPRLADADSDGDFDLIIGSIDELPLFFENTGNNELPAFEQGANYFSVVEPLDAEMGVCIDIDGDGDPDFISGGFTGLNLYLNIGTPQFPEFEKSPGFFDGLNVGQNPVPDFTDIDNDGDPDMVTGFSESGLVKIYLNSGNMYNAEFSEGNTYEIADVGLYAYPVFCDIDQDDDQDLLVGRDGHGFKFYRNTGDENNALWQADETAFEGLGGETYWNSPTLSDLTGDGKPDLIFGTASGPLNYFVQSGTPENPVWTENTSLFGGVMDAGGASNPCFFDFDNDGDFDLFTGSQMGDIKFYENTGTISGPAWEENNAYFTSLKHSIYSAVAIGDVNGDSLADAIVGDLSGNLYYHRNTGIGFEFENTFFQGISMGGWSAPCLEDMDDDGDLDIVAGGENGVLHYIENQGNAQAPDWLEIAGYFGGIDVGTNCVPALVDIDYDGDFDVVCGDLWGDLFCYINNAGEWIENTEILDGITGEQNTTPAFADLDNDGDPDLSLGQYNGTFSYFRNQYLVTGLDEKMITEADLDAEIFPNPFKDKLCVSINLNNPALVEINILNACGKVLMHQNHEPVPEGRRIIQFETASLPNGFYFIQIITRKKSTIYKAVKF